MSPCDPWAFWSYTGAAALMRVPVLWRAAGLVCLISVGVSDILHRKVSNAVALSCLFAGVVLNVQSAGLPGLLAALGASCIAFAVALVPYIFGTVGAADVKVFAALGAWVGPGALVELTLYAAIFAGLMGAVALLTPGPQRFVRLMEDCLQFHGALNRARADGTTMPLTVAFCISAYLLLYGGAPWLF